MDGQLLERLANFGPAWLRYAAGISEAVQTGQVWVVAAGEDIALWETDSGAVLPVWPAQGMAAAVASDGAQAVGVAVGELAQRLLPFLVQAKASVTLFPNFTDDMLVEPAAAAEDLADSLASPTDISVLLEEAPRSAIYDEWALLELPALVDEQQGAAPAADTSRAGTTPPVIGDAYRDAFGVASAAGALWLLDDPSEDAIVGVVLDDRPALALFATAEQARAYGERVGSGVTPRAVTVASLISQWLLLAHGASWAVALSPGATEAFFVEPARFALDLAEAVQE